VRAQQALVQAQKLEAIGTLVGGIAHDFNNLLAAILGFAELAQASHFDGCDPTEDFAELTRAVSRARNIVAQLLAFSRPTAEERYPVDLGRIVRESMRLLRAAIPSAVEFKLEVSRQPIYVLANATHLQQILMNLCTNAAQAMPNGGRLMVRVERHLDSSRQPPEVMLSIGDTGTGMSPEIAEKVFDPFFTTKPVGQGTGLGLSTVHGLVAAHGGRIELFTQLGIGSTFSIYLPETTLDSVVDDSEPESGTPSGEGEHLVIVDDEPSLTQ
jgi:signal transduction histidine kinase